MINYLGRKYNNVAEIKEQNKLGNIEYYKKLYIAFLNNPNMAANNLLCDQADTLVRVFGMTYDELEALEIEVLQVA